MSFFTLDQLKSTSLIDFTKTKRTTAEHTRVVKLCRKNRIVLYLQSENTQLFVATEHMTAVVLFNTNHVLAMHVTTIVVEKKL